MIAADEADILQVTMRPSEVRTRHNSAPLISFLWLTIWKPVDETAFFLGRIAFFIRKILTLIYNLLRRRIAIRFYV